MDRDIIIALVAAIPPTLAGIAALIMSLRNKEATMQNKQAIAEVHISINSRLEQLLHAEKRISFREGVQSETDKQK